MRITVDAHGTVLVSKPKRISMRSVEQFILTHKEWIETAQAKAKRRRGGLPLIELPRPRKGSKAYREAIANARTLTGERLLHFNALYATTYGTVSIRNQKTRWGSCSARNNLSFNYKIIFLPPHLADYIIVHELCHTLEHNHSDRFWAQVSRALPNHTLLRKEIRTRYQL
ncbi:MAG: YgjP-like metallopeptidase domain-containing protein [Patescibacteria group bacterium]